MNTFTPCEMRYVNEEAAAASTDDYVELEQAEWSTADQTFWEWMTANDKGLSLETLSEYWEQKNSICSEDGHIDAIIYAYPSRPDLYYELDASYGELTGGGQESAAKVDRENVRMETSHTLDAMPTGEVTASWDGVVYDEGGGRIEPPPAITVNGQLVTWGGIKVKGVLVLKYSVDREVYVLTIFPRETEDTDQDKSADAYASTVTAFWDGGYNDHEVDIPDLDSYCRYSGRENKSGDDPDALPCYRRVIVRDPCTNAIKSERLEQIPCPEE